MDKVKILVIGKTNSGKTTIAHVIKNALKEEGFKDISLTDTPPTEGKMPIEMRVEAAKNRPIEIEVISVNRISMGQAKKLEEAGVWKTP